MVELFEEMFRFIVEDFQLQTIVLVLSLVISIYIFIIQRRKAPFKAPSVLVKIAILLTVASGIVNLGSLREKWRYMDVDLKESLSLYSSGLISLLSLIGVCFLIALVFNYSFQERVLEAEGKGKLRVVYILYILSLSLSTILYLSTVI